MKAEKFLLNFHGFIMCVLVLVLQTRATNAQICVAGKTFNDQYGSFSYSDDGLDRSFSWKIIAPLRQHLSIVIDNFQTATCTNASTCTCTFLAIKDGECSNSSLIGRYCGARSISRLSSSGRYLRLEFVSNGSKSTKIKGHFTVSYSRVTTCRTLQSETHTECPNPNTALSHNECCISNGKSSCCSLGGSNCTDSEMYSRSYCPRPFDEPSKTVCCITDSQPSCCESGGNYCNDDWKNNRSYCPSTHEEKIKGSVICCTKNDQPYGSCCITLACRPLGKDLGEGVCIVIWCLVAVGAVLMIGVCIVTCRKWPLYSCLVYPIRQCWPVFFRNIEAFFKWISFAISLVFTTLWFTIPCCFCFGCIQEWPWKAAYRIVSKKFGIGARTEYENL